jgi:tellurite resistance protein TerC
VILAFIGLKLVLHFAHLHAEAVPELSTGVSLAVIVVVLGVTTVASLIKSRRDPTARAHAGYALRPGSANQNRSASRADAALRSRG